MRLIKNDQTLTLICEYDNNRQFKAMKRSFFLYRIKKEIDLVYDKVNKKITLQCRGQETYDQIFKGMEIQSNVAAKKGQKVNLEIIDAKDFKE